MRRLGIEQFERVGFPGPKEETWKYTRLRSLEDTDYRLVTKTDGTAHFIVSSDWACAR